MSPPTGEGRGARALAPGARRIDSAEPGAVGGAGGVLPAAEGAHRAELRATGGDGNRDRAAVALALRAGEGKAQVALPDLEVLDVHSGKLRTAQGAGEADQKRGPVAQATQVVGGWLKDRAQDGDVGGQLLGGGFAAIGGLAADAGHGLRDPHCGGRNRAAAEQGDDVRPLDGEAGQGLVLAPRAPGADQGAAAAFRLGAAGIGGAGAGGPSGFHRAVVLRGFGLGGGIEPAADCRGSAAQGRRVNHRVGKVGRHDSGGRQPGRAGENRRSAYTPTK